MCGGTAVEAAAILAVQGTTDVLGGEYGVDTVDGVTLEDSTDLSRKGRIGFVVLQRRRADDWGYMPLYQIVLVHPVSGGLT